MIGVSTMVFLAALLTGCVPEGARTPGPTATIDLGGVGIPSTAPSSEPTTTSSAAAPTPVRTSGNINVVLATYGVNGQSVYASGIIPERADQSGMCTLTATSGNLTRSAVLDAAPSPAAMNCGQISVAVPAGKWSLSLQYSSGDASGASDSVTVTVP